MNAFIFGEVTILLKYDILTLTFLNVYSINNNDEYTL